MNKLTKILTLFTALVLLNACNKGDGSGYKANQITDVPLIEEPLTDMSSFCPEELGQKLEDYNQEISKIRRKGRELSFFDLEAQIKFVEEVSEHHKACEELIEQFKAKKVDSCNYVNIKTGMYYEYSFERLLTYCEQKNEFLKEARTVLER